MSIKDKFGSLKDFLGGFIDTSQESGYKPVIRVVTQNSYKDKDLGTRLLIDTVPADVRLKIRHSDLNDDPYADISTGEVGAVRLKANELYVSSRDVVKQTVTSIKDSITESLTGGPSNPRDRPLEGCAIDSSITPKQQTTLAHMIFQNPTALNPDTQQLFGTDLLKVGFPIWIYLGYIDQFGNIVSHPFDKRKRTNIPLVFGGFVGALTQEINEAGDRMLLMAFGYMWYLSNFSFEERGSTGTRDLIELRQDNTLKEAIDIIFNEFYLVGGKDIPVVIKKALRLKEEKADKSDPSSPITFKPSVRYIYGALGDKTPVEPTGINPATGNPEYVIAEIGSRIIDMVKVVEHIYHVDIEWDSHGYITVHGHEDPFSRTTLKKGSIHGAAGTIRESTEKYGGHVTRIHDVILGGNVRNFNVDVTTSGVVSGLRVSVHSPNSSNSTETFSFDKRSMEEVLNDWTLATGTWSPSHIKKLQDLYSEEYTSSGRMYGLGDIGEDDFFNLFGSNKVEFLDVFHYSDRVPKMGKDYIWDPEENKFVFAEPGKKSHRQVAWPKEALEKMFRRMNYWGMRGSAMLIGNSDIKEGDLIRVTDIRPKGSGPLNFNLEAYKKTVQSIAEKSDELIHGGGKTKKATEKRAGLAIEGFLDVFFVWKVTHYLGPVGFWTKVWFVPQRDSLTAVDPLLKILKRKREEELAF